MSNHGKRRPVNSGQLAFDFGPPLPQKECPPAGLGRGADGNRRTEWSFDATVGGNHTPPAAGNNAPGSGWFDALRADRRLTMAAVSLARLMQDGRPRSLVEFSAESGFSLRQVPEAVKRLEAAGYVRVIRTKGGPGNRNRFVRTIPGGAQ
ncbi:MAG: Lrp/AsnC family transcriptional regulator [Hyphomicrobiales bacterium]|nr:MAG: Lrp/AsnC family transcriptional regulator [Hyphomicrobiales bacterium]